MGNKYLDMNLILDFYVDQFRTAARGVKRPARINKYLHRMNSKIRELQNTRSASYERLLKHHKDVKMLSETVYYHNDKKAIGRFNRELLPELMRLDLFDMSASELSYITEETLKKIKKESGGALTNQPFSMVYRGYVSRILRKQIVELVPAKPEMEFAETHNMKRHFVLHVGPTNSGKTYHALERLKLAKSGVYLGPLRLLALEVYEKMNGAGVPCTMLTGQECLEVEGANITASTVEMLDIDKTYEVAVIDEAQMVADESRGHSWTRAILGVKAEEIHVCMSPAATEVVTHLIRLCKNSDYEIKEYKRMTGLELEDTPISFPEDVKEGDALIVFSKKAVLNVAGRLEQNGIGASVIYGSLPPEIRRRQMDMFLEGETKVVVSTDAIGMGLNLPVRRIVFMEVDKYDGKQVRALELSEIKQIAGRAGRYGIYENGYITAMDEGKLNFLKRQLAKEEQPIQKVTLGFPQVLLSMEAPLDVIIHLWKDVKPSEPFEKINIEEMMFLYNEAYKNRRYIVDFDDKYVLYKMITCPIDIKDREVVKLWNRYCETYTADIMLTRPSKQSRYEGLHKYESYYKKLDLYYQFSMRMGKLYDARWLEEEREATQDHIMELLALDKDEYILRCKYCGKILPIDSPTRLCRRCSKLRDEHWGFKYS